MVGKKKGFGGDPQTTSNLGSWDGSDHQVSCGHFQFEASGSQVELPVGSWIGMN